MKLLREPLVHFVAIGAVLFALDAWLGGGAAAPDDPALHVEVTRDDLTRLAADWEQQWGAKPSATDQAQLIAGFVEEELLVREARRLGITADDSAVRRKLAERMEYLSRDQGLLTDPDEAQLQAHLDAHPERFTPASRIAFSHILFAADRRGPSAPSDAKAALARLRALPSPPERAPELGDPFSLRSDYAGATPLEVELTFGAAFARAVSRLEPGVWGGPIASPFGQHLVRVAARHAGATPPLTQVRAAVLADWIESQRRANYERFLAELRERYHVTYGAGVPAPPAK